LRILRKDWVIKINSSSDFNMDLTGKMNLQGVCLKRLTNRNQKIVIGCLIDNLPLFHLNNQLFHLQPGTFNVAQVPGEPPPPEEQTTEQFVPLGCPVRTPLHKQ
jgi:hypothetical protein